MDTHNESLNVEATDIAELLERIEGLRRILSSGSSKRHAEIRLMRLFADQRPRTLRQVAEQVGVDQSTANRQVNSALDHGLLSREREAAGLPYLFVITDDGLSLYERYVDYMTARYRAGLEALGMNRAQFEQLMRTFVAALDSDPHAEE